MPRAAKPGIQGSTGLTGRHMPHGGAGGLCDADAAAVVGARAHLGVAEQSWRVGGEHIVVVDETAGGEHTSASCPNHELLAVVPGHHADHRAIFAQDQIRRVGVVLRCHTGRFGRRHQTVQQQPSAEVMRGRPVPARGRDSDFGERPTVFPEPHEPVIGWRYPGGSIPETGFERHTAIDEPVEMRHAVLAVVHDLRHIRARPERRHQECRHLFGTVIEPARPLDRRTAAEVDLAT